MERKLSKKMPSNSRPPLTTRIRASFENKRTKSDIQSPTNPLGFISQQPNPEALHNAVQEVMNSEVFQTAIAANLAKILKPTIKDALDTIQPVVETVYNHEMLLRKTNQSVENLLEIVTEGTEADNASTRGPATPSPRKRAISSFSGPPSNVGDIRQLFEENNAHIARKIQALQDVVEAGNEKTKQELESLATVGIQEQLNQLKTDLATVIDRAPAQDIAQPSEHFVKLDAISTHLEDLKNAPTTAGPDHTEALQTIAASLEALKENVQAGIASSNESFNSLTPQIGSILTTVEAQGATLELGLGELQQRVGVSATTSDGGAGTAAALQELKNDLVSWKDSVRVGGTERDISASLEPQIATIITTLDNHTASLGDIKNSHTAHASALDGLKSVGSSEPGASASVEPQLATILAALESHTSALSELKDSHTAHAAALDGLQSVKAEQSGESSVTIEPQVTAIAATLASHSALLSELKESHASHANTFDGLKTIGGGESGASTTLEPQISTMIATLDAHTAALAGIQDSHAAHSATLDSLKSIGGSETGESASLKLQIDAMAATLNSHTASLGAIQELHAAHSASLGEIKSLGMASSGEARDSSSLEPQIAAIIATQESHTATLTELQELHNSHAAALAGIGGVKSTEASVPEPLDISNLESQLTSVVATLDSHTGTLTNLQESHVSALEGIKSLEGATVSSENITNFEPQIKTIIATLEAHSTTLCDIQESHTSHVAALENVRSIETNPTASEQGNASHLQPQLAAIVATLEAHTASLDHLKGAGIQPVVEDAPPPAIIDHAGVEAQIAAIKATLETHTTLLNEIKDDVSAEILTVLQDLSGAQANNATLLSEIREADASSDILTALHASNDSHALHSSAFTNLQTAVQLSNDSHGLHATALDEIKSAKSIAPETADIGSNSKELGTIISALEEHKLTLAEIKEASSSANDLHASHLTALTDLKAGQLSGGAIDISGLETHIENIISTLEAQSASLSDIRGLADKCATATAIAETQELIHSHTALLNSINDANTHADILDNISSLKEIVADSRAGIDEHGATVRELNESSKDSHSQITEALAGLAHGGAAGVRATVLATSADDNSSDLLAEVKAVRMVVEKSLETTTTMAAQIDINHTTIVTSVTTLGDELRAEIDASGTGVTSAITALSVDVTSIDLNPVSAAVSECGREINLLSAKLDSIDESTRGTSANVEGLRNGFHLSDKGVSQLKEHAMMTGVPAAVVAAEEVPASLSDTPRDLDLTEREIVAETPESNAGEQICDPAEEDPTIVGLGAPIAIGESDAIDESAAVEVPSVAESDLEEKAVDVNEPVLIEEASIADPSPNETTIGLEESAVIEEPVADDAILAESGPVETVLTHEENNAEETTIPKPTEEEVIPSVEQEAIESSQSEVNEQEPIVQENSEAEPTENIATEAIKEVDRPLEDSVKPEDVVELKPDAEQEPDAVNAEIVQEIAEENPLPVAELEEEVALEPNNIHEDPVPETPIEIPSLAEESVPVSSDLEDVEAQDPSIEEIESRSEIISEAEDAMPEDPTFVEPGNEIVPTIEDSTTVDRDIATLEHGPSETTENDQHVGSPQSENFEDEVIDPGPVAVPIAEPIVEEEISAHNEQELKSDATNTSEHQPEHQPEHQDASTFPEEELDRDGQQSSPVQYEFMASENEDELQSPRDDGDQGFDDEDRGIQEASSPNYEQSPVNFNRAESEQRGSEQDLDVLPEDQGWDPAGDYQAVEEPIQHHSTGLQPSTFSDDTTALHDHASDEHHIEIAERPSSENGFDSEHAARYPVGVDETHDEERDDPTQDATLRHGELSTIDDIISNYQPTDDHSFTNPMASPIEGTPTESDYGDVPSVHDSGAHVDGHALDEDIIADEPDSEPYFQDDQTSYYEDPADIAAREEMAAMNAEFARAAAEQEQELGYGLGTPADEVRTEASSPFITYPPSPTGTAIQFHPSPSGTLTEAALNEPLPSPTVDEVLSPVDTESPMSATFPGKSKKSRKAKKTKKPWEEEFDADGDSAPASGSTSAITSPLSPDFPESAGGGKKKRGKKGRNQDSYF